MHIEGWRVEIDKIDAELLRLLNARAEIAVRVGESKRVAGLSVLNRGREREALERARANNGGPLANGAGEGRSCPAAAGRRAPGGPEPAAGGRAPPRRASASSAPSSASRGAYRSR